MCACMPTDSVWKWEDNFLASVPFPPYFWDSLLTAYPRSPNNDLPLPPVSQQKCWAYTCVPFHPALYVAHTFLCQVPCWPLWLCLYSLPTWVAYSYSLVLSTFHLLGASVAVVVAAVRHSRHLWWHLRSPADRLCSSDLLSSLLLFSGHIFVSFQPWTRESLRVLQWSSRHPWLPRAHREVSWVGATPTSSSRCSCSSCRWRRRDCGWSSKNYCGRWGHRLESSLPLSVFAFPQKSVLWISALVREMVALCKSGLSGLS